MTNIQQLNVFNSEDFKNIIAIATVDYQSDISWGYRIETKEYCIDFYQDETGLNHIAEFAICKNNLWIAVQPSREQTQLMFEKLNQTPYRDVEPVCDFVFNPYDNYGVDEKNFF